MTTIHIRITVPTITGVNVGAKGKIRWTPTLRRNVDPNTVVLPKGFDVDLVSGEARVTVAPTTINWCWKVEEGLYRVGVPNGTTRYVSVPDSETVINYIDLPDLDPATLEPSAAPSAVWDVELSQVDERVTTLENAPPAHTHDNLDALDQVSGTNTGDEPDASTSVKGVVELATTAETTTGTDTTRATTPAGVKAALDAKAASDMSTYATRIRAGAPRLTMSHAVHHTGDNFRWSTQTDERYVTFLSFYHLYYTAYKTTGPVYALSRPTVGGTLQHVWKSIDGGETWAKMFELTIDQSAGEWFEHIFVEPYYETVYLQKTTTGHNAPYAGFVESYTPAGVLIGSKDIGDSRWISGNHAIDYCPNTKHVVIFGEYASDTKAVVNLWRTTNKGLTWTSVLAPTGNNGGIAGEVRHFHAVAADPYTKHWWAASGDADAQCKIYRSTDDGLTWTVLYSGSQHERTTSFVFTADHVYYGTDYPALTDDHSKLVRITKSDLSRTDVATIKDGFPVWALTKTYAPEGILVWPSCEFASNTPQDYVTVQWFDFATEELLDVARFTIADYTTGTEGIHDASRHQDVMTGSILFTPTGNVQRRGGFDTTIVSAFSKGRLVLPSA